MTPSTPPIRRTDAPAAGQDGRTPVPGWRDDVLTVLPAWLMTRALVIVGAIVAYASVDRLLGGTDLPTLQDGLLSWDAAFYRDIADRGYLQLPEEALRFFPLHPLLGRLLNPLLPGGAGLPLVLIANAMAFLATVLLLRLVRLETGDDALATRTIWLFSLFPTAFVLAFGYAEALFLVAAIGTFLCIRTDRWWLAALLAAAAAATRPQGILLVLPMVIEGLRDRHTVTWRDWVARAGAVAGAVVGAAAYLLWVEWKIGGGTLPLRIQEEFRGDFVDPVTRIFRGIGDLVGGDETLADGLHVPFALLFVGLLVVVAWRLPASYTAFTGVSLVLALGADNLNSLERYGLNAFPLLIAFAVVVAPEKLERPTLVGSGALLASFTALALMGAYVP